jgi:hypothetical protein
MMVRVHILNRRQFHRGLALETLSTFNAKFREHFEDAFIL